MAIYYRDGRLIFWAVNKRLVLEIRLPIFIWRTNSRNGRTVKVSKANFVRYGWLSRLADKTKKEGHPGIFYNFLTTTPSSPQNPHES